MRADLLELEAKIGYCFRDRLLLVRALTHSSFSSECRPGRFQPDNEQLEFFGDSILGFLISELLLQRHPDLPEGQLSLAKSHLVSARRLYEVATRLGVGEFLQLGRSEEKGGGRLKKSLLADAIEAILAAIYLDGGMDAARAFVSQHVYHEPLYSGAGGATLNYKGALWERAGAEGLPTPQYVVIEETGPQHQRQFTVEARLGTSLVGRGTASSKKAAQQAAARDILEQMSAVKTEA